MDFNNTKKNKIISFAVITAVFLALVAGGIIYFKNRSSKSVFNEEPVVSEEKPIISESDQKLLEIGDEASLSALTEEERKAIIVERETELFLEARMRKQINIDKECKNFILTNDFNKINIDFFTQKVSDPRILDATYAYVVASAIAFGENKCSVFKNDLRKLEDCNFDYMQLSLFYNKCSPEAQKKVAELFDNFNVENLCVALTKNNISMCDKLFIKGEEFEEAITFCRAVVADDIQGCEKNPYLGDSYKQDCADRFWLKKALMSSDASLLEEITREPLRFLGRLLLNKNSDFNLAFKEEWGAFCEDISSDYIGAF